MRLATLSVAIACTAPSLAAQELVSNGSFEQYTTCPSGPSQLPFAPPWIPATLGTPDYFNACDTSPSGMGVPTNGVGTQPAFAGDGYGGFIALYNAIPDYREYLQSVLLGPGLEAGKTYRFSMELCLAENSSAATDRVGAYFSSTPVSSTGVDPLPFTPQVETPLGTFLDDYVEWMNVDDTFVADGGEQYVTIGNFHDEVSSGTIPAGLGPLPPLHPGTAYYYVDVVSLQCEPCFEPPTDISAWWPLDETSGALAYDVVAAQHGVHVDSPVPGAGYVDGALDFLASSVSVATTAALEQGVSDFSIDAWVKPSALGTDQALFTKLEMGSPYVAAGYAVVLNADGTISFTMVDDTLASVTATSVDALVPEEWTFIAITVDRDDPSGGRIYIDDAYTTFDPTGAPGDLTNPEPFLFATDGGAGLGADFVGSLDEVEVFHIALTELQALGLYQARTSGKCKTVLEIEPVVGVPITTGLTGTGTPTIGTNPNITNGTGVVGTFNFAVKGEKAGTSVGPWTSTVDGPKNPVIRTQQPLQVAPGRSMPIQLELDVPAGLRSGESAAYSVTVTHLESGRRFVARGLLRGRPGLAQPGVSPPRTPVDRGGR